MNNEKTVTPLTDAQIIEGKLLAMLEGLEVKVEVFAAGTGLVRDSWICDGWRVVFTRVGIKDAQAFDYFTGIGHRSKKTGNPLKPVIAGVLHSLLLDSSAANESLNEWCDNFGYDSNSIKVLNIYKACLENADKLKKIFSNTELQSFSELLEDY